MGYYTNDEAWFKYYKKLEEYYEKNSNILVPAKYVTDDGVKLGNWLKKQKELYSMSKISDKRILLLEKLGISWSYLEDIWNHNYSYLKDYYDRYGNSDVPQLYVTDNGIKLGEWLHQQKAAYKNGILPKRRIRLLKELDVKWNLQTDNWDEKYYMLEDYYKAHNNIDIPTGYETEDGTKLGRWLYIQKQAYKGHNTSALNRDRIMLLNDLNIDWSNRNTKRLNSKIDKNTSIRFKKVLLERMKNILEDLSYEMDGNITDLTKQKEIEKEIIKRMWR